jgi:hypothetical protein
MYASSVNESDQDSRRGSYTVQSPAATATVSSHRVPDFNSPPPLDLEVIFSSIEAANPRLIEQLVNGAVVDAAGTGAVTDVTSASTSDDVDMEHCVNRQPIHAFQQANRRNANPQTLAPFSFGQRGRLCAYRHDPPLFPLPRRIASPGKPAR